MLCEWLHAEAMMTGMIILSVICGILSVLLVALTCYVCARRYYIKVCLHTQPPTHCGTLK